MVKLEDLKDYITYCDGVSLEVWALRNAVKTGTNLNMGNLMVECVEVDGHTRYLVCVYNSYCKAWDRIATGMAGYSPMRFSLCGRRGDKDRLIDIITKLRFLGIDISMSFRHEEWEDIYLIGRLVGRDLRASWVDTPADTYGELD